VRTNEVLALIGRLNDTMNDQEILRLLEEHNRTWEILQQPE
jgi:hypothetical protein